MLCAVGGARDPCADARDRLRFCWLHVRAVVFLFFWSWLKCIFEINRRILLLYIMYDVSVENKNF